MRTDMVNEVFGTIVDEDENQREIAARCATVLPKVADIIAELIGDDWGPEAA